METDTNILHQEGYNLMGAAFEVYNEQGGHGGRDLSGEPRNRVGDAWDSLESEAGTRHILQRQAAQEALCAGLIRLGQIVVELKSVSELLPEHEAQLLNYMRISKTRVGYLINFGHKETLEWKRFILTEDELRRHASAL